MLNRWIKPNKALDEIIAHDVHFKYGLGVFDEVIVHSFMMHDDDSLEFNIEIRCSILKSVVMMVKLNLNEVSYD
ncbi:hypothetical protein AVV67_gp026 [Escherichia phage vB_EcoM_VR25]|uniref:Uncharacterized protein n=1 Tax=Escherichia phage vB_EcoM_VR25 TaxID=1567028 RepID=A0A0A7HFR7_9CAUD|nr:hypothetical protein AVV67_gp026 [Escherichia phage vB_EcoM_VR25]AIZ02370.1 hypothetical protein VR25_026 [Escherichia phage vB_EcoM_VR25]